MRESRHVRPAAVAGTFYPASASTLTHDLDAMLAEAKPPALHPKALVVPHAGFVYSGPIAATAFATLKNLRPLPTKVVLLGPTHHVGIHGLALPAVDAVRTPLGEIEIDKDLEFKVRKFGFVTDSARAHEREHSLEVQLPFLQRVLPQFTLLPLAVGHAAPHEVEQVLNAVWGGPETLIVVSSDLSHYLPYEEAQAHDRGTAARIISFELEGLDGERACGVYPLRGLLLAAEGHGLEAHQLDLRNSGDTAGDRSRVVGYGAFAFCAPASAPRASSPRSVV